MQFWPDVSMQTSAGRRLISLVESDDHLVLGGFHDPASELGDEGMNTAEFEAQLGRVEANSSADGSNVNLPGLIDEHLQSISLSE